jgi:hypothetical protein
MSTRTSLTGEQFIVDAKGRKTAVLLPIKRYQALLEDLHDLAVVAERREEEPIPLEQVEHRLREEGLLARSPRFRALLDKSRQSIQAGKGVSAPDFWEAVAERHKQEEDS